MFNSFIIWFKNLFSYADQPTFEPRVDVEKFPPVQVDGKHSRAYVSPSTPFTRALDREGLVKPRLAERCTCGYVPADCNIYRNTPRCKKYVEPTPSRSTYHDEDNSGDLLIAGMVLGSLMSNHNVSAAPEVFQGGGGKFGGAGAEDSWDVPSSVSTTSTPTSPMVEQTIQYAIASDVVQEAAPELECRASDPDPTPSASDDSSSSSDYSSSSSSSSSDYSSSSSDSSSSSSSDSSSSSFE